VASNFPSCYALFHTVACSSDPVVELITQRSPAQSRPPLPKATQGLRWPCVFLLPDFFTVSPITPPTVHLPEAAESARSGKIEDDWIVRSLGCWDNNITET